MPLRCRESAVPDACASESVLLKLPAQWASYAPAWDIAAPILRSQSVVGDPGRATGLEVAVEPWRLLETLLERTLVTLAATDGDVRVEQKTTPPLLTGEDSAGGADAFPSAVEPDGLLTHADGRVLATFEAKYSKRPKRDHVYQALATAAALTSPVACLLYPWSEPPRRFDVTGFHGHPQTLMTIGVDLFGYRRGDSERELTKTLQVLLAGPAAA